MKNSSALLTVGAILMGSLLQVSVARACDATVRTELVGWNPKTDALTLVDQVEVMLDDTDNGAAEGAVRGSIQVFDLRKANGPVRAKKLPFEGPGFLAKLHARLAAVLGKDSAPPSLIKLVKESAGFRYKAGGTVFHWSIKPRDKDSARRALYRIADGKEKQVIADLGEHVETASEQTLWDDLYLLQGKYLIGLAKGCANTRIWAIPLESAIK